jgi:hypothetical protein
MREKLDFSPASIKFIDNSYNDYKPIILMCTNCRTETNYFGQRGFTVQEDAWEDNIHAVLETLDGFVKEGKSNIGLSNENPWGIMRFLEESKYNI